MQLDIPTWSMVKNPFYYKDNGFNNLLITVGDSWTYGDSLGNTCVRNGQDDTQYRLDHVYGNLIAEQISSDWMNLALPGISNFCMLNWLNQLLTRRFDYKNITCVITLTETGRHEEISLVPMHITKQQQALEHILQKTYSAIETLSLRFPLIKFLVAHNFTDSIPNNLNMCEKTWLEVLTDQSVQNDTHIVVSEHIEQLNYGRNYPDRFDIIDRALKRIDILDSCKYCCKEDSRHPLEDGHKLWANYLASQL